MMRTAIGLSFVMALGAAIACGSESTNDKGNAAAGNGSVLAGGSSGGSASDGGGTKNTNGGGTRTNGGAATGTSGATGVCADQSVTCVDATHAMGCNLDTGVVDTFSCVDELAGLGIVSTGCTKDAVMGDSCDISDFADQACADGTGAFAYCENATTDEQFFNIYVNCFQDNMDGHTVIPCFSQYVTPAMKTADNCTMAESACLGIGAGGAGAGGASTM